MILNLLKKCTRSKMLEIRNLNKKYENKEVLRDINLNIERGKIITILGKNGAGKTSLLNCILKLTPFNSGHILLDNENINNIKNKDYFKSISAVLENSDNVYYYLTGMQNIIYFGSLYGMTEKEIFKNVEPLIKLLKLEEDINNKVAYYSRGMVQKLSIIISMINNPSLLILDEPTLGLDIFSKRDLLDTLKNMTENQKITVILTTHQMEVVEYLNSKVALLENGVIKFLGEIEKLKSLNVIDSYLIKYILSGKYYEQNVEYSNFDEVYNYLINKKVDSIIEIKKNDKSLEKLLLDMEKEDV